VEIIIVTITVVVNCNNSPIARLWTFGTKVSTVSIDQLHTPTKKMKRFHEREEQQVSFCLTGSFEFVVMNNPVLFLVHDCYIAYNGIHSMSMVNLSCGIHVTLNGECLSSQLKCERKITFRKPTLWLKNHTPKPLLKDGKFPVDWLQFK